MDKVDAGECLGGWLKGICQEERLSLRQAAAKTGLSHVTISDIIAGKRPSGETILRLATAFSCDGAHQRLVLEDKLLTLAGYRSGRPEEAALSEPVARLLDKVSRLNEAQLKIMERFADFVSEMEGK